MEMLLTQSLLAHKLVLLSPVELPTFHKLLVGIVQFSHEELFSSLGVTKVNHNLLFLSCCFSSYKNISEAN